MTSRRFLCFVFEILSKLIVLRNYDILEGDGEFKYLRSMRIEQVEEENITKLLNERDHKMEELESFKKETPKSLWSQELNEFKERVENIIDSFDIALVSCGGYANPICSFIYEKKGLPCC